MMITNLDVHDLPEDEVKVVQKVIDLFRIRGKMKKEKIEEKIEFAVWPLGVKGKLTRQEIYDYL
jgi:hypothetical protein